jgi:hypothetical protein
MSKIVYLRTANQPHTDLALIQEQLQAIHARLDCIPTRAELARAALGIIFCTAGLVIGWFELVSRHCF